ncbi:unnamed protein product [Trichogramma brassicae]|uniref:Uncharacterized protein n=1 Tax=Trichogramma brassicae TaxID=86971 RepID=A0A6H5J233_9HYME|nr:unnamed protein product [Trichogramma brassicae]
MFDPRGINVRSSRNPCMIHVESAWMIHVDIHAIFFNWLKLLVKCKQHYYSTTVIFLSKSNIHHRKVLFSTTSRRHPSFTRNIICCLVGGVHLGETAELLGFAAAVAELNRREFHCRLHRGQSSSASSGGHCGLHRAIIISVFQFSATHGRGSASRRHRVIVRGFAMFVLFY